MLSIHNFKKNFFLVYGLGLTGKSVVNFFEKNKIKNYEVWDDKIKNIFSNKRSKNLNKTLKKVNYIILSPGISLNIKKNYKLKKFKRKFITDLDLIFLLKKFSKSIVVTGTNGKSTTCKILEHLLKHNKYKALLGGNIGTPILDLKIKNNNLLIIEASSFQLAYSKFIKPDYAILLNITNDHLDWHGNIKNYIDSKFKIFESQTKSQFAILNKKFESRFKQKKYLGKLIFPNLKNYLKIKSKIKNSYLKLDINDENMSHVLELSKLLKINNKSFIQSFRTFKGLPHRYEIFLRKKNYTFINDSKATSFEATKSALKNSKNIYWIVGGLPKKNDKIILDNLKNNIVKIYIIGKRINFFKKQIKIEIDYQVTRNLKNSLTNIFKDIRISNRKENIILLSPASASFDQFNNFERRGEEFKKLSNYYARKYI